MTAKQFRQIALSLPATEERSHMNHPDFRVAGKIFATLAYPDKSWAMVKLTSEQQHYFSKDEPEVFLPVNGAWGRRGATRIKLRADGKETVRKALRAAWENTAPKTLQKRKLISSVRTRSAQN